MSWFFEGDEGQWVVCDEETSQFYEENFSSCNPVSFTRGMFSYDVDFQNNIQTNVHTNKQRRIMRQGGIPSPSPSSPELNYLWSWDNDGRWKKFSREAAEELEKGFEENNFGTVDLRIGRTVYQVDFSSMKQTNTKTQTQRDIKMEPKKNSSLGSSLRRWPSDSSITSSVSSLLIGAPDDLPQYFKHRGKGVQLIDVTSDFSKQIEMLMNATSDSKSHGQGLDSHGEAFSKFRVISVERVEHKKLWRSFDAARKSLFEKMESTNCGFRTKHQITTFAADPNSHLHKACELNHDLGECFLFHGTLPESIPAILEEGFDTRIASGYFGKGSYFAENSSKADQYVKNPERTHKMFLSRVLVGDAFEVLQSDDILKSATRPPCKKMGKVHDNCLCEGPRFDSVIAQTRKQHSGAHLIRFREFVVFERCMSYPELLITYERV